MNIFWQAKHVLSVQKELLIVRLLDLPEQMTLTLIDWEFFSSFRAQHYRELYSRIYLNFEVWLLETLS